MMENNEVQHPSFSQLTLNSVSTTPNSPLYRPSKYPKFYNNKNKQIASLHCPNLFQKQISPPPQQWVCPTPQPNMRIDNVGQGESKKNSRKSPHKRNWTEKIPSKAFRIFLFQQGDSHRKIPVSLNAVLGEYARKAV